MKVEGLKGRLELWAPSQLLRSSSPLTSIRFMATLLTSSVQTHRSISRLCVCTLNTLWHISVHNSWSISEHISHQVKQTAGIKKARGRLVGEGLIFHLIPGRTQMVKTDTAEVVNIKTNGSLWQISLSLTWYQVLRGVGLKVQLSDEHAWSVTQDNKVACCHCVAPYEPRQPSLDAQAWNAAIC